MPFHHNFFSITSPEVRCDATKRFEFGLRPSASRDLPTRLLYTFFHPPVHRIQYDVNLYLYVLCVLYDDDASSSSFCRPHIIIVIVVTRVFISVITPSLSEIENKIGHVHVPSSRSVTKPATGYSDFDGHRRCCVTSSSENISYTHAHTVPPETHCLSCRVSVGSKGCILCVLMTVISRLVWISTKIAREFTKSALTVWNSHLYVGCIVTSSPSSRFRVVRLPLHRL